MPNCKQCTSSFEITDKDRKFYEMMEVPEPKQCPQCRLMRRMQERNARRLYRRKCDSSGEKIISQYHEDAPFPVYEQKFWWSDGWDPLEYGRDFDFSRPFFEQFKELKNAVPHMSLFVISDTLENSEFTNCVGYLKNCYLIAEADLDEDCYYSNRIFKCKNLVDCNNCHETELSYQCIDCNGSFGLRFCQECQNCSDSWFLKNCAGVKDSIACINQRQKQFMIFNEQFAEEEYKKKLDEFKLDTYDGIQVLKRKAIDFFKTQPHKAVQGEHNQNVSGDHVYNSKNAKFCFDCIDLEDVRYGGRLIGPVKTAMDYTSWGFKAELIYQTSSCGDSAYNLRFCSTCTTNISNLTYCFQITRSSDLFGCVGVKDKKFCIFNKQYSEEEYKMLRDKIIAHMKEAGEWGEYFPADLSSFGYNETIAMDVFPLTKEEALQRGYNWCDYERPEPEVEKKVPANQLPQTIAEIPDDVLNWAIVCEKTGKPFRLTKPELEFYRKRSLPIPHNHPDQRHQARSDKRAPYQLFDRKCEKCQIDIQTTYASDRPEKVYCEKCYLKEVY